MSFDYSFEAPIVRHSMGSNAKGELVYTVVFVPPSIVGALPDGGPLRVKGEIAEMPVSGALMPVRAQRYLMVPRTLMRERGVRVGEDVEVRFSLVDPNDLDLPNELSRVFKMVPTLLPAWNALTPGRRRGAAHHVASARRSETRDKRARKIADALREGRDPTARD